MGWHSECGTHEGYLVALVFDDDGVFCGHAGTETDRQGPAPHPSSGRMRELGTFEDGSGAVTTTRRVGALSAKRMAMAVRGWPVSFARVACACGWRSPLLRLPLGCSWQPSTLYTPEAFEDKAALLWQAHVRESGRASDGGYSIEALVRGGKSC